MAQGKYNYSTLSKVQTHMQNNEKMYKIKKKTYYNDKPTWECSSRHQPNGDTEAGEDWGSVVRPAPTHCTYIHYYHCTTLKQQPKHHCIYLDLHHCTSKCCHKILLFSFNGHHFMYYQHIADISIVKGNNISTASLSSWGRNKPLTR